LDDAGKAKLREHLCIGCAECLLYCPTGAIEPSWSSSSQLLQERMVEYALGALQGKGRKVAFLNFLTDVSPDCDCAPWHDASLVPDIGILGSHDIVAIDQASADLINAAYGIKGSRLQGAFLPGEDKFRDVHVQAFWEIQLEYAQRISLGKREYTLENL